MDVLARLLAVAPPRSLATPSSPTAQSFVGSARRTAGGTSTATTGATTAGTAPATRTGRCNRPGGASAPAGSARGEPEESVLPDLPGSPWWAPKPTWERYPQQQINSVYRTRGSKSLFITFLVTNTLPSILHPFGVKRCHLATLRIKIKGAFFHRIKF